MKNRTFFVIAYVLMLAAAFGPLHAIKITVPKQYEEQLEVIKDAERAQRQSQLNNLAEGDSASGGGLEFTTTEAGASGETIAVSEPLVQSLDEAADTADEFESAAPADKGFVSGQIVDQETGEPIGGVAIVIEGTDVGTVTGTDGRYTLGPIAAGEYTLSFIKSGYIEANVTEYNVLAGEVGVFPFALPPRPVGMSDEVYVLQDFSVTAEEANQMMALADLKQTSVGQIDFLSTEDFARFAGSNIADLVGRIAGVNVVEGQFAVVRGLGDRYNSTLLNDLPVPSPDPVRQGVQLDLFPTSVVESVIADKAFTPSLPSNSSGAAFNLITKAYPEDFTAWVKTGVSVNENAQDSLLRNPNIEPFQGTPGGNAFDWSSALGRESVSPSPSSVAALDDSVGGGLFDFGGRSYQVGIGDTYDTPWGGRIGFITSTSYSSSSSTRVGTQQDRFGRNSFTSPFPIFFPSVPGSQSEGTLPGTGLQYDFTESTVSEDASFLFGLGLVLDEDGRNSLDLTYLRSRSNISEASRRENGFLPQPLLGPDRGFGQNTFSNRNLIIANDIVGRGGNDSITQGQDILSFEQRTLEVFQFSGDHQIELFGRELLTIDWGGASNKATSEIGNPTQSGFVGGQSSLFYLQNASGSTLNGPLGVPSVALPNPIAENGFLFGGDAAVTDGFTEDVIRNTARTIDDSHDAYRLDLDIEMTDSISVQVGGFTEDLDRAVLQRDIITVIQGDSVTTGDTLREFVENTVNSPDTFEIDLDSFANVTREVSDYYFQTSASFWEDLEVVVGLRQSSVDMTSEGTSVLVPGFPLTGTAGSFTEAPVVGNSNLRNRDLLGFGSSDPVETVVSGEIDEDYSLPVVTLKYTFLEEWVLRLSYGKTYALPSPRELSPVFTVDTFTGDRVVGNPNLVPSDVNNFGARIERTFGDEAHSVGVSVFRKRIENPIEQIGLNHSLTGIDVQSFINNENTANVEGVELDARIGLSVIDDVFDFLDLSLLRHFSIGGNVAYIDARVGYPEVVERSFFNANTGESIFSDGEGNLIIPSERRLFDQPEWTLNFDASFEHPDWGTSLTLALYAQSDVLTSVGTGSSLTIDQFTASYHQIDLTWRQTFGANEQWELVFTAENLTDTERGVVYNEELVSEETERFSYRVGRTYGCSLEYNF